MSTNKAVAKILDYFMKNPTDRESLRVYNQCLYRASYDSCTRISGLFSAPFRYQTERAARDIKYFEAGIDYDIDMQLCRKSRNATVDKAAVMSQLMLNGAYGEKLHRYMNNNLHGITFNWTQADQDSSNIIICTICDIEQVRVEARTIIY